MRVITGSARGRRLNELKGYDTRPTTDKVKEGIFSAIQFEVEGARVLDLFAGTGQLGIEALSRGAQRAVFVDRRTDAVKLIRENLALTRLEEVMAKYSCPGVLVGDLNAAIGSKCLDTAHDMGWNDAFYSATGNRADTRGHHPCYAWGYEHADAGVFTQAIDHILVKGGSALKVVDYLRVDDEWFDCISDHYPVYATVELI